MYYITDPFSCGHILGNKIFTLETSPNVKLSFFLRRCFRFLLGEKNKRKKQGVAYTCHIKGKSIVYVSI